jgi:hypothetical protein
LLTNERSDGETVPRTRDLGLDPDLDPHDKSPLNPIAAGKNQCCTARDNGASPTIDERAPEDCARGSLGRGIDVLR